MALADNIPATAAAIIDALDYTMTAEAKAASKTKMEAYLTEVFKHIKTNIELLPATIETFAAGFGSSHLPTPTAVDFTAPAPAGLATGSVKDVGGKDRIK